MIESLRLCYASTFSLFLLCIDDSLACCSQLFVREVCSLEPHQVVIKAAGFVDAAQRMRRDVELDLLVQRFAVQAFPLRIGLPLPPRPAVFVL